MEYLFELEWPFPKGCPRTQPNPTRRDRIRIRRRTAFSSRPSLRRASHPDDLIRSRARCPLASPLPPFVKDLRALRSAFIPPGKPRSVRCGLRAAPQGAQRSGGAGVPSFSTGPAPASTRRARLNVGTARHRGQQRTPAGRKGARRGFPAPRGARIGGAKMECLAVSVHGEMGNESSCYYSTAGSSASGILAQYPTPFGIRIPVI